MNRRISKQERAQRITAWTWAAETLGIEITPERLRGLVDVTRSVRLPDLQPAIREAMATEERGFMPAPGLVIKIAKRLAAKRHDELAAARRARDRDTALLEANASPISREDVEALRQKISKLAQGAAFEGATQVHGWRPANTILPGPDDSAGMASVRAAREAQSKGAA